MYLDGKRIAIMVTTCVLMLLAWWSNGNRNQSMYDRIEEMETGASSNPGKIAAAQREYANTVFEAIAKLKKNEFNEASLLLYHSYPAFENYLNAQGQKKVVPNLTLR